MCARVCARVRACVCVSVCVCVVVTSACVRAFVLAYLNVGILFPKNLFSYAKFVERMLSKARSLFQIQ